MTIDEVRNALQSPKLITDSAFEIVQSLCTFTSDGTDSSTLQELVLRALDKREFFGEVETILSGLVRAMGLFPYLHTSTLSLPELIAYEFHRPFNMDTENIVFHRVQGEVYRELLDGKNVILSAPTSFGKSLIIDAVIATEKFRNIVIIVPTIALIDETRRRMARFHRNYKTITHPSQKHEEKNIFVLTQERFVQFDNIQSIEFFVIDEFYKLNPEVDKERSLTLNHALYRLLKQGAQFYMLGPNIEGIPVGFSDQFKCTFIHTDYVTVVSEIHNLPDVDDREQQLVELCQGLHEPTLIYCASPARANKVVSLLLDSLTSESNFKLRNAVEWLGREYHREWRLTRGLSHGIGLHHGRIPRSIAEFMVRAFNNGLLNFLVCTSTLIEGVNTKAKNVIIFDNRVARRKFDYFTFNNIRGRSGRMFSHFIGHVYLFDPPPEPELPLVDMPFYTQDDSVAESLLVQIDINDLSESARKKLSPIFEQTFLDLHTIRESTGISPMAQIELAQEISDRFQHYLGLLVWHQFPTYEQLKAVCVLIWDYLVESKGRFGGISSGEQLAFKVNQLRNLRHVRLLIDTELKSWDTDPDKAVEGVLEFLRNWASFHFPRYLACVDRIQKSVFSKRSQNFGDYSVFGSRVENLFLDPTLVALEEYGLPIQVSQKIEYVLKPDGDLDAVLERMRGLSVSKLDLEEFEIGLLEDTKKYL